MIKLGMDEIRYLNALSKLSGVNAKDCIIGEKNITFIVPEKDMGQAIGKNGSTIEEIRKRIGKNVELIAYTEKPEQFLKKAFNQVQFQKIESKENALQAQLDYENKSKLLQQQGKLKRVKEALKRNYNIAEVRIR